MRFIFYDIKLQCSEVAEWLLARDGTGTLASRITCCFLDFLAVVEYALRARVEL